MKIVFRVDSSQTIGCGHMMRCLTLAEKITSYADIWFISQELPGNVNFLIEKAGYNLEILSYNKEHLTQLKGYERWLTIGQIDDAKRTKEFLKNLSKVDYMIVDNYAIDIEWERLIRPYVNKIMVIDDLANRQHDCDILLDQTYGGEYINRYQNLVSKTCKLYLGIKFVLLRQGFYIRKKKVSIRAGKIKNILIFFGGNDDTEETIKLLYALKKFKKVSSVNVNVIVGKGNEKKNEIQSLCKKLENVRYYCQVSNIEDFIALADVGFGAAGGNTWERCFLGLPTIVTITADNQKEIAKQMMKKNAVLNLGWHEDVTEKDYTEILMKLDSLPLTQMSENAFSVISESQLDFLITEILQG